MNNFFFFFVAFQILDILFWFRTKPVYKIQNQKSAIHEALPAANLCQNLGKFIWLSQLDTVFTGHGTKTLDPSAESLRIFIQENFLSCLFP